MTAPQDPLIEEALHWLVILRDRAASEADRLAFERWRTADPRHDAAWRHAQEVWMRVGRIGPAFANRPRSSLSSEPPVLGSPAALRSPALRPPALRSPGPRLDVRPSSFSGRRRLLYGAAAAAAVAIPAAFVVARPGLFADHGTAVGERRSFALADGTMVELAGASALSVDFSAAQRRVVLHDGEAFFEVARDPARPFVVEAAGGLTRAQGRAEGSAFDVKRDSEAVTVAVVRRDVGVAVAGRPAITVGEGQRVRYGSRGVETVLPADLAQVEGWRRDRLIFHETPLGDVVADLERYRGGRIVMTDRRLRVIPVTAVFDTRQADAALDTIGATLPIKVRRLTAFLIVLSPSA